MAAAPALIVTAEAPVLRVPNRPGKRRHAPSQPGKARHLADNVRRAEAVLAVRAEVVAAQVEAVVAEAVVVAEEVVVVAGERVQEHEITWFAIGKKGLSHRLPGH